MKKFLKFFNIFELNLNEKSYKSPLIRIFASLAIMFAVCIFRLNITITSVALNIFLTVLLLAIMVMSILCFFIASVEALQVGENKRIAKAREQDKKK